MNQHLDLTYHQSTLRLINEQSIFSGHALEVLDHLERERNIVFPASVREWYSLTRRVDILGEYSNTDHPTPLEELGKVDRYWSGGKYHDIDFLSRGLLIIMSENQGVWTWAIRLDGSDDPPVVVAFDTLMPFSTWEPCADTFSTFVYTRVWDHQIMFSGCVLFGSEPVLSSTDLRFLKEHFTEGPQTYTCPQLFNYRFSDGSKRMLLYEGERSTDWYLRAESEEELLHLTKAVWKCGTLEKSLESWTPCGNQVLAKMRDKSLL